MKTLRYYQRDAIDALYQYWTKGGQGNSLIVLPTGTGKSLVIAKLISELVKNYKARILVLTHVKELIEGNYQEFIDLCPELRKITGIYSASVGRKELNSQILFAGIQSIEHVKHKIKEPYQIVIVDECHLIPFAQDTKYRKMLDYMLLCYPHLRVIGLSATPYRLDKGYLHKGDNALFSNIVYEAQIQEMIDQGFLSNIRSKDNKEIEIDTKGIKKIAGEFSAKELETRAMEGDTTKNASLDIIEKGKDRKKWIIFASGVDHAEQINDYMCEFGIKSAVIHGQLTTEQRTKIVNDYKNDLIKCLVNMNILTTGFNVPKIDLLAMLRPTQSAGLYCQIVGRGMRIAEGKTDCLILDYSGNVKRHGLIDQVQVKEKKGDGSGVCPCKTCPECDYIIKAMLRICPYCGYEYPETEKEIEHKAYNGALLKSQLEPETFKVDKTTYQLHVKDGRKSVKVSYLCGIKIINEWLFPESDNSYAQLQFKKFCYKAGVKPYDKSDIFVTQCNAQASEIKARKEGKYYKIIEREYLTI